MEGIWKNLMEGSMSGFPFLGESLEMAQSYPESDQSDPNQSSFLDWKWPGEDLARNFRRRCIENQYNSSSFIPGETPFSTFPVVVMMMALYLIVVLGGREVMTRFNIKAFNLRRSLIIHNGYLSVGSLMLLITILAVLIPKWQTYGFLWTLCSPRMEMDHRLTALYYVNYIIKYVEFIDTVFLMLRKKPLEFLHVYHHVATMLLCYVEISGYVSVQWVPIVLNLMVHTAMYLYYTMTALGHSPWWKKYLTSMQITQFVLDLIVCYGASYLHFSVKYFPRFGLGYECHGVEISAVVGDFILTSYLMLFISFFIKTYITKQRFKKDKAKAPAKKMEGGKKEVKSKDSKITKRRPKKE